ncbi:MAG: hypothetical protein WCO60_00725 [Verrucomicrobiota bacterium]
MNQFQQAAQAAQEAKERAKAAEEAALSEAEATAAAAAAYEAAHRLPDSHPAPIKFSLWQRITNKGGSFLFISIVFHLLLLAGAAVYVVQTIHTKEKLKFTGAGKSLGSPGQKSLEYKVQTVKRSQSMSTPMVSTRLTSTSSSVKVAIPDAPTMTGTSMGMPAMMGGMGGSGFSGGGGAGGAAGGGMGVGGAMAAMPAANFTVFGFKGSGAIRGLNGHLYDMKQSPERKPTEQDSSSPAATFAFLKAFSDGKFDLKMVKGFFQSPVELMATRFWIPNTNASEMPKSFAVEKDVKPTKMLLHYRAKIAPPKDGRYRFIAYGDDFLGIRFNGKVILPFDRPGKRLYCKGEEANAYYEVTKKGHAESDMVQLRSGQECDIEIMLCEAAGGLCAFSLLVEREEDKPNYKKTPDGLPILPIFETEIASPIPEYKSVPGTPTLLPPRDPNRIAWKVLKETVN